MSNQMKMILCAQCKHRPIEVNGRVIPPRRGDDFDYECPFVVEGHLEVNRAPALDFWCKKGEVKSDN